MLNVNFKCQCFTHNKDVVSNNISNQHILHTNPTQHPLNVLPTTKMLCEQQHIKSTYSQQCPHSTFYPLVINWKLTKLHIRPKPDLINILPTLCLLKICFHVKNLKLGAIITIPRLYQHNSQTLSTPFPDSINTFPIFYQHSSNGENDNILWDWRDYG